MFPTKEMGGGSGLKYVSSSIVYLSKRKEKDGTEVVGNIIHCKNHKSRLTKENKMVDVRLTYDKGLDRYYGLLELAEKYEVFKKSGPRFELLDGSKQYAKTILNDPDKFFTEDIMHKLDLAVRDRVQVWTDVDIDFYCRAYDDFLSPADCEAYIDKYEETLRVDNERWKELSVCIMKDGNKNPTCGNCSCDRLGPMEFDGFVS